MSKQEKANNKRKKKKPATPVALPVVRSMVAGLDIGSSQHWVCGPPQPDGEPNVRVFGTTTEQLNQLADWLAEQKVESVAMESTYVYWIPVYELLESRGVEVVLVNARQLHNVPGRKTDFSDCQWLQLLHSCGLLRGSFRPGDAIVRIRALQRQMANLVEERTRCVQWMQKSLDQMNIQVHRAVSDITGETGMAIVRAIVAGQRDSRSGLLAALAFAGLAGSCATTTTNRFETNQQLGAESMNAEIRTLMETYQRSLNEGDVKLLSRVYADDAVFIGQPFPTATGLEKITALYADFLSKLDFNVKFEILEVELGDTIGFVRTQSVGTIVPKGETPKGAERKA